MIINLGMLLKFFFLTFDIRTISMIGDKIYCSIEKVKSTTSESSVLGNKMLLTKPSTLNKIRLVPKSDLLIILSLLIEIDFKKTSLFLKP